jgi:hypothetical protein
MKFAPKGLLLLSVIVATFSLGQTANTPIKHVIVVIQENRTPDNLFQDSVLVANGADIVSPTATTIKCNSPTHGEQTVRLAQLPMDSCADPNHDHGAFTKQFDKGAIDGACNIGSQLTTCSNPFPYPCPFDSTVDCSSYTYVSDTRTQLYYTIAEKYGFANYAFQTNQGPSFPAHQFLLSGTSAPDYDGDNTTNCGTMFPNCWQWFAGEGAATSGNYGCIADSGDTIEDIDPNGNESAAYTPPSPPAPPGAGPGFPCYNHNTMPYLLEQQTPALSWKYYVNFVGGEANLWTAPNAIVGICGTVSNGHCTGSDFTGHVSIAPTPAQVDSMAPDWRTSKTVRFPV